MSKTFIQDILARHLLSLVAKISTSLRVFGMFHVSTYIHKYVSIDLNSTRRELSNGGLRIAVALTVRWKIFFHVFLLGVQSVSNQL